MERMIPWAAFVMLMTIACFLWPRAMRAVMGIFFGLMGLGVHGAFLATRPAAYIDFCRQALIPMYGDLAEAVVVALSPVVFGSLMLAFEVGLAALILSRGVRVKLGFILGILFLVAITPLGVEVLPNIVLAAGLWGLARKRYEMSAFAELHACWKAWRKRKAS